MIVKNAVHIAQLPSSPARGGGLLCSKGNLNEVMPTWGAIVLS